MQVFYLIPPENIFFNEGTWMQLLHDAQDNADTAGLLNGQLHVFLHFFLSSYGYEYANSTEGLL